MKRLMIATTMMVTATFAAPAMADEDEAYNIELFQQYMEIADQFVTFANSQDSTVFFAVEGIVEIHEERGELAAAIPLLQNALEQYPDNQPVRNIIRFKLRDLYRDTGQTEMALAELQTLIEENR